MSASLERIAEVIRKFEKECFRSGKLDIRDDAESEDLSRGIHSLVEKLKKVEREYYMLPKDDEEVASSSRLVSKSNMVGLCDQRTQFKENVVEPWVEYTICSVTGMAGIGKTALAREIFDDLDISEWFDCRAWVSVGKEWRSEEITEAILARVDPEACKVIIGGHEAEIGAGLKEILKGKRYLIVLDDVWNDNVLEYVESSFADNRNGSRVLLTTRMKYVCYCAEIYSMRLLDKEESWDLLREKVFVGESCPPHLEKAGKKIAEKCDGLPLTILTVANLLSKAPESVWIDVATKKKHQLFVDVYDQISKVLYPSYNILNDDKKLCFLYLGAFPQKYEIPKSRLINVWIAEKFVGQSQNQTLESCAVERLNFLEYSSLVVVYQRDITSYKSSFDAHVKTCGLHSSWWHFCQREARNANLFHVLDCYNRDTIEEAMEGHGRLSIQNNVLFALKHVHNSIEEICAFTAHSLLCFGPYCQYMVHVCFGLKFLRRLDALNIRFYDFPLEVLKLVKLRYLALTCNRNPPPSISDLRKLQYLIVHPHLSIKSCGSLPSLPMAIWDMKMLKYLHVIGYDLPDLGDTSLQNLTTLSDVTTGSCTILNRVPNLRKLGIKIELAPDQLSAEPLSCFDHISHLTKLESLKCVSIVLL